MGAASSIFDCAINPLNPLPEESAGGAPQPVLAIEDAKPLRDSLLWRLQRAFYEAKGVSPWSEGVVPNFVTTNSFVARAYARIALGLLRDAFTAESSADPAEPLYIIELGAGHGKLAYLVVETLLRYRGFFPANSVPRGLPFRYVITDAFAPTVQAWRAMPVLREFFDLGVLDVAVFDAERDTQMTLQVSGTVLSPAAPLRRPSLVIANYTFDSLTTDSLRISGGVVEQGRVTLTSTRPPQAPTAHAAAEGAPTQPPAAAPPSANAATVDAGLLGHVKVDFTYTPVAPVAGPAGAAPPPASADGSSTGNAPVAAPAASPAVYGEPVLDALVSAYARHPLLRDAASLLVPLGALRAVRSLTAIATGGLALIVGDKGHTRAADLAGHRDPHVALHGSFSFMVNFHALRVAVAAAHGACAMTSPYADGFKSAAYFFAPSSGAAAPTPSGAVLDAAIAAAMADETDCSPDADATEASHWRRPFPHARWAFRDGLQAFTAEDFAALQRCLRDEVADPSLRLVLALLRLAHHDSEVFFKFRQVVIDKSTLPGVTEHTRRDLRSDVDRAYAAYFPLVAEKDVCFELGRVLMGLKDFSAAVDFFGKSNECCGAHHITWHNMGICHYFLDDMEAALECFKQSLQLSPSYGEARMWWDKASLRAGHRVIDVAQPVEIDVAVLDAVGTAVPAPQAGNLNASGGHAPPAPVPEVSRAAEAAVVAVTASAAPTHA